MNQKREKLNCPVCRFQFIPESFNFEKVNFDPVETKGEILVFADTEHQLELKPFSAIRGSYVTYCPQCRYLIKFAAEIGRKEKLEDPSLIKKLGGIKEFGKIYKYNYDSNKKPYMDYTDYFIEKADSIKKNIKSALDKVNFVKWGLSYNKWRADKSIDSFKFLIHFYSDLIDYLNSQVEDQNNKTVVQKIEELNLSKSLELLIKQVEELRTKITHETYELNEEEEALVERTFTQFMYYLIMKQLKPLNLNNIKIEPEYDFIDLNKIRYEIQEFLDLYLGKVLHIKEFHSRILIPIFEELGVRTPDYNP